jgi:tripartite-type tricarboxylate transporter receptor subunit TctC
VPIALLARGAYAITVHPSVPANSLAGLIAHAKANPGKLSYATAGTGSGNHLAGEQLKSLAGLPDIAHVPYKGAGPALTDVVGGHVPIGILSVNPHIFALHGSGQVRVLATTAPKRLAVAPGVPTAVEAGLPGMVAENFVMLFVPQGTPKSVIDRLHAANELALAAEDLQQAFAAGGLEPVRQSDPDAAAKFLQAEIARWLPLIQALGLKK